MNPYVELPQKAYWKTAVASKSMFDISDLWDPKFKILTSSKVSTFGSCFAQHIGRALNSRGFSWLVTESPPQSLSLENSRIFNYNIFSARTGNIYTTSLLRQWVEWALGEKTVPDEVWEDKGRYFDPFRPVVEPNGFSSIDELRLSQKETLSAFLQSIRKSDFFVFTLGLTESWIHAKDGYEYPMCPGTVAGEYLEGEHIFKNQQFSEIIKELNLAMQLMRGENPKLKFILTVSPVPLTATNSGNSVLVATMESKSILRAVAGQVARKNRMVDYFPSYEIINSPVFKGVFFNPNQRTVNQVGVNFVMDHFFSCLESKYGRLDDKSLKSRSEFRYTESDAVCEEELLNAFR